MPSMRPYAGATVLLVEDQTLIALDTESMLLELGIGTVHTFATAAEALAWLATGRPDVGVLDVSLGSATSFPVADALLQRSVPFMFTTGYGDSGFGPERFLSAPIVRKPYTLGSLAEGLAKCFLLHRSG